jgi:AcrR family transcriptional regulator
LTPTGWLDFLVVVPRRPKTQPRRPPVQKRSLETVDVLLQATERVLTRDGFAAATTNKIAEVAGVSIGTLYHYFPTKEALVEALVHRMWAAELEVLDQAGRALADPSASTDAITRAMVSGLVAIVRRRQMLYRRWYGEASHLGQLELGLEMVERAVKLVRGALEQRRSELRPPNLEFASDFIVKIALAAVRTAGRDWPRELESGVVEEAVCDLVVRYLVK